VELYNSIRRAVHVVGDERAGGGVAVWDRPADTGANVIVQECLPTRDGGRSRRTLWRLIRRGGTSSASSHTASVLADHYLRLDNDDRVQQSRVQSIQPYQQQAIDVPHSHAGCPGRHGALAYS